MSTRTKPKGKQTTPSSDTLVEIPIQDRLGGEALELFLRGLILQDRAKVK